MRRVIIFSYTETGRQLNSRIEDYLVKKGDAVISYCRGEICSFMSTKNGGIKTVREKNDMSAMGDDTIVMSTNETLRQEWNRTSAFVFIGAMGIAVRQSAPFLKSKVYDPAVLVLDEKGQYVIPVLSGHIGGGVALARELAVAIGGQAVITTATDVEERFAVDVFAYRNHLWIENPGRIKMVSSALLQGRTVDVWTSLSIEGEAPDGLRVLQAEEKMLMELPGRAEAPKDSPQRDVTEKGLLAPETAEQKAASDIAVLIDLPSQLQEKISKYYDTSQVCVLNPRRYILGIGCKRGKTADEMEAFLKRICERQGIDIHEIGAIASIDVKKEEPGIWELSRRLVTPFEVFSAQELERVEEAVTVSDFVKETVGVDNVCERSAYCLAKRWTREDVSSEAVRRTGDYSMALGKQAQDGITMALVKVTPQLTW